MRAYLNGELLSHDNSGDIFHPFERMIEHVSRDETTGRARSLDPAQLVAVQVKNMTDLLESATKSSWKSKRSGYCGTRSSLGNRGFVLKARFSPRVCSRMILKIC